MKRRSFLLQSTYISLGFIGLSRCTMDRKPSQELFVYGPLSKDPASYLDLPKGFSYKIISKAGNEMTDGFFVPGAADGMAAFGKSDGKVMLVRNHELSPNAKAHGPFGEDNALLNKLDKNLIYDYGGGDLPSLGGTTNLLYNEVTGQVELEYLSLVGTNRNCAGGPTPWDTWITCEEDVTVSGEGPERNHGYNFEVHSSSAIEIAPPVALKDMGRFNHEAVCVSPKTSIVYQTEDRGDGLIYRFIPNTPGKLHEGGKLQALAVKDKKKFNTSNWTERSMDLFTPFDVEWIDLEDVESPDDDLRYRGFEAGAALFARGEGMWHGQEEIFFACTSGGPDKLGQVFKYIPSPYEGTSRESDVPGKLVLFAESDNKNILKNCDNLTVAPWGDVILCEDHRDAFLRGITPEGKIYTLGHNVGSKSEFAGVTFSPSGNTLFVNIQGPGHTLAITGPWNDRLAI